MSADAFLHRYKNDVEFQRAVDTQHHSAPDERSLVRAYTEASTTTPPKFYSCPSDSFKGKASSEHNVVTQYGGKCCAAFRSGLMAHDPQNDSAHTCGFYFNKKKVEASSTAGVLDLAVGRESLQEDAARLDRGRSAKEERVFRSGVEETKARAAREEGARVRMAKKKRAEESKLAKYRAFKQTEEDRLQREQQNDLRSQQANIEAEKRLRLTVQNDLEIEEARQRNVQILFDAEKTLRSNLVKSIPYFVMLHELAGLGRLGIQAGQSVVLERPDRTKLARFVEITAKFMNQQDSLSTFITLDDATAEHVSHTNPELGPLRPGTPLKSLKVGQLYRVLSYWSERAEIDKANENLRYFLVDVDMKLDDLEAANLSVTPDELQQLKLDYVNASFGDTIPPAVYLDVILPAHAKMTEVAMNLAPYVREVNERQFDYIRRYFAHLNEYGDLTPSELAKQYTDFGLGAPPADTRDIDALVRAIELGSSGGGGGGTSAARTKSSKGGAGSKKGRS